jgi:uncharacterized protein (DUF302 family)
MQDANAKVGPAAAVPVSITKIEHTSIATGLSYEALVKGFERELGRWDPTAGAGLVTRRAAWSEVEREIAAMGGPRALMIFFRADQGVIASLEGQVKRCSLYIVGNPVIASQIISIDRRGSFLVPFRVSLYDDGGPGGAVMAYDRPSSFLGTLGRPELDEIGRLLDHKIDGVADVLRAI